MERPAGSAGRGPRTAAVVASALLALTVVAVCGYLATRRTRPSEGADVAEAERPGLGSPAMARPVPSASRATRRPAPAAAIATPAADEARQSLARLRERIGTLFQLEDQVGPGAGARASEAERELYADPGASSALRALYAELPREDRRQRWSVVETLGEHPSPENVALLRDVAVSSGAPDADPDDLGIERRAALGVLEAYAASEPSSADALQAVLEQAGPATAKAVALELWRRGLTAPWQREILQARGLPDSFRQLTPAELERLRPKAGAGLAAGQGGSTKGAPAVVP